MLGFKKDSKYDDLWKLMSDEQIINCQKGGLIEIGSHGFLHNNLGRISHEKACSEILDSKNYLENLTQSKMKSIAYPDGSYSRALIDYCENLGFKNQLAAEGYLFNEDESDPRIHDRKGIYDISDNNNLLYATLKIKK